MLASDGTEVWVRDEAYAMADDTQSGRRMSQGLLVDMTDRKRLESKLIHDALHDPLTGLANRVLLRDHLERALARHDRSRWTVALLFVDLDDFKRVNDSYGHVAGDQILVEIGARRRAPFGPRTLSGARAATSSRSSSGGLATPTRRSRRPNGSCASCAGHPARRALDRGRRLDRDRPRLRARCDRRRAAYPGRCRDVRGEGRRQGHAYGVRRADADPNMVRARGGRLTSSL